MAAASGVEQRPFGRAGVGAPTACQAARYDQRSIEDRGVPEPALMENAGRQAALIVEHLFPKGEVVALVGSGNNGGDALVCLRALAAWGRPVSAVVVGKRPVPDPVLHGWELPTTVLDAGRAGSVQADAVRTLERRLAGAAVVVDGLLGTGIKGAPRPAHQAAIEAANRAPGAVVALDAPSGVDGTDGTVPGAAVEADATVAFGWPKLGTLLHPGRGRCGRLVAVEIGFPPRAPWSDGWAELATPGWASQALPRRSAATHKNEVGALAVVAGPALAGAAALAARSAFRCGAGLVRVCGPADVAGVVAAVPEVVFVADTPEAGGADASGRSLEADDGVPDASGRSPEGGGGVPDASHRSLEADDGVPGASGRSLEAAIEASRALVVGPGLGTNAGAARRLERALAARAGRPAVLDADALTLLSRGAARGGTGLEKGAGPVVATPHPGEMARLLGCSTAQVQQDRVAAARGLAEARGVVVLLKGAPSLVAEPGGRLLVATVQDTSDLAVAGMGDVLAGAVGAFLAQGVEPFCAAGLALDVTGRAASACGLGPSLVPSDVIEAVPAALAQRGNGRAKLPFPFVVFDQDAPR